MPSPFQHPQAGDLGRPPRYGVRASYTANLSDLTAATTTCDTSVTLVEGDLVLLTEQTASEQNGIYQVGAVSSGTAPLTRWSGAASSAAIPPGTEIYVSEGTSRANSIYVLTTDAPITIATTSLTFSSANLTGLTSLATRVSTEECSRASVGTAVSTEATTRSTADVSLTTRISDSESSVGSDKTRISTEECTRSTAASSLTLRVSNSESSVGSLHTRVSTEECTRSAAASSLALKVSALFSYCSF